MKLSLSLCTFLLPSAVHAAAAATTTTGWEPTRVDFAALQHEDAAAMQQLRHALQTVGLVSLTGLGLPTNWKVSYTDCVLLSDEESSSSSSSSLSRTLLASNHRRTTFALSSEELMEESTLAGGACDRFHDDSLALRQQIDEVIAGAALWKVLMPDDDVEVLYAKNTIEGESSSSSTTTTLTVKETMEQALVLEHFHAYQQENEASTTNTATANMALDWHIDQGMFLAFCPGTTTLSGPNEEELWIQLPDGRQTLVHFDPAMDELILMVGDGVTTILNPHLDESMSGFRPLPHALELSSGDETRVWYGRMMLPPSHAFPPTNEDKHRLTYGEWRQELMKGSMAEESAVLGCSGGVSTVEQGHRFLQLQVEADCNLETQAFCWNRCMNLTDYGVSPEICAETDELMECATADFHLWDGEEHNPDYGLACLKEGEGHAPHDDDKEEDHDDHDEHDHDDHDDEDTVVVSKCSKVNRRRRLAGHEGGNHTEGEDHDDHDHGNSTDSHDDHDHDDECEEDDDHDSHDHDSHDDSHDSEDESKASGLLQAGWLLVLSVVGVAAAM